MLLTEYGEFLEQVDSFRSEMLGFLKDYDVILCPVNAHVALPHGTAQKEDERGAFTYTQVYNITGWPGAVVRGGTSPDGLPIGVEIIGRPWREDVVLAVAAHIESVLGGFHPPSL
jgi:amidase